MYKGISGVLITVLVVAVIGTGFWGYQENQEKNSILIKAENQYQRAFHDLNYHIEQLHDELGKTLAVNSRKQLSPSLANVWRLSYTAQSDVGQLPLVLMPFNKTEEFLAKVGDFSYRIAIRDLNENPLSDTEYKTLNTLYQNSKEIQNELQNVQKKVIEHQLRWMDVELALAMDDKQADNTIIDGFKTIDKKVQEFPEVDWGPGVNNLQKRNEEKAKNLKGSLITAEDAKKKALEFLGIKNPKHVEVNKADKSSDYNAFSVTVKDKDTVYLDVTKTGGYVVWMIKNREINKSKLSVNQAIEQASAFLTKKNFKSMVHTQVNSYGNSLIINFAYSKNNVIIYPDTVSVKIALDNGEVLGFQSTDYIYNHKNRTIPEPKLTKDQALKYVNPKLKVNEVKLAIIEGYDGKEVLTYEITGKLDTIYRVYINADNGDEEEVQKLAKNEIK